MAIVTVKGLIGSAAPDNVFGSGEVVHLAEGECLDPNRVYVDLMLSCPVLGSDQIAIEEE